MIELEAVIMKIPNSTFALLIGLIGFGAGTDSLAQKVVFHHDQYNDSEIAAVTGLKTQRIDGSRRLDDVRALFAIQKSGDGNIRYAMRLTYTADRWIFAHSPLDMLIDGESKKLSLAEGTEPERKVWRGEALGTTGIQESLTFALKYGDLVEISKAKMVRFRLNGSEGFAERAFSQKNLKSIQELAESAIHLDPTAIQN
jgi:hypothetical protein